MYKKIEKISQYIVNEEIIEFYKKNSNKINLQLLFKKLENIYINNKLIKNIYYTYNDEFLFIRTKEILNNFIFINSDNLLYNLYCIKYINFNNKQNTKNFII